MLNKKRYWFRGGILALLLYVVITAILIPFGDIDYLCSSFLYFSEWLIPPFICIDLLYINLILIGIFGISFRFLLIIIPIIVYFLIGTLLGWIYGKIKNRKQ
jgi:hypothetical protein